SHNMDTLSAPPLATTAFTGTTMSRKPKPAKKRPAENFDGLDGTIPRSESDVHTHAKTGASATTKNEFTTCSHSNGTSKPKRLRFVKSFAKRLSDDGACSNADQKIAANTNSTMITATRFISSLVSFAKKNK